MIVSLFLLLSCKIIIFFQFVIYLNRCLMFKYVNKKRFGEEIVVSGLAVVEI